MLRRLLGYELKKTFSGRFLLIVLFSFLLIHYLDLYRPWTPNNTVFRKIQANSIELRRFMEDANQESINGFWEYFHALHGANAILEMSNLPDGEWKKPGRLAETISMEYVAATHYFFDIREHSETLIARERVVETARRLGQKALAVKDDYSVRRNIDIVNRYSADLDLGAMPTKGWDALFYYTTSDYLVLLWITLFAVSFFPHEKNSGSIMLLHATKWGRSKTAATKMIIIGAISIVVSFMFSALNLLYVFMQHGLWGWSKPAAAASSMAMTPLNITLWQAYVLFSLMKAFGALCLSVVLSFSSNFTNNSLAAYIVGIAYSGTSLGYGKAVKVFFWPEFLSIPDITLWFRPMDYLSVYNVSNVFTYPVYWVFVHFFIWFSLIISLCCFIIIRNTRISRKSG